MQLPFDKYRLAAMPAAWLDRLGLMPRPRVPVAYVVEKANWSTHWDGTYVCREIEKIAPGTATVVANPQFLARRVVHFFSQYQWDAWRRALPASNRYAVTFYHGKYEDGSEAARGIDRFLDSLPHISRVVTAASLVEERLLRWGVPREKLVRIPIPINLGVFTPVTPERRRTARAQFGIPPDHLVIGSFQKDGVGWGDGNEPKLIKGPDVLLETVARVAQERPVFVLLTGPARGFVKRGLERVGVPYTHQFLDDYEALPRCYAALDVYLNPSSEEGGPKGLMESMASGIPIVSTRVGMAPDLIVPEFSGFIADPGDAAALAQAILRVTSNESLRERVIANAREAVRSCDVTVVGQAHWENILQPMLRELQS